MRHIPAMGSGYFPEMSGKVLSRGLKVSHVGEMAFKHLQNSCTIQDCENYYELWGLALGRPSILEGLAMNNLNHKILKLEL